MDVYSGSEEVEGGEGVGGGWVAIFFSLAEKPEWKKTSISD